MKSWLVRATDLADSPAGAAFMLNIAIAEDLAAGFRVWSTSIREVHLPEAGIRFYGFAQLLGPAVGGDDAPDGRSAVK